MIYFICSAKLFSYLDFSKHFKLFHSFDNIIKYTHIELLCDRVLSSLNSYGKHLKSHFDVHISNPKFQQYNSHTFSTKIDHKCPDSNNLNFSNSTENNIKNNLSDSSIPKNILDQFKKILSFETIK